MSVTATNGVLKSRASEAMGREYDQTPCAIQRATMELLGFQCDATGDDPSMVSWHGQGLNITLHAQDPITPKQAFGKCIALAMTQAAEAVRKSLRVTLGIRG